MQTKDDQNISSHGVGYLTASERMSLAKYFAMDSPSLLLDESFFFFGATGGFIFF